MGFHFFDDQSGNKNYRKFHQKGISFHHSLPRGIFVHNSRKIFIALHFFDDQSGNKNYSKFHKKGFSFHHSLPRGIFVHNSRKRNRMKTAHAKEIIQNQFFVNPQSHDHGPQSYAAFILPLRRSTPPTPSSLPSNTSTNRAIARAQLNPKAVAVQEGAKANAERSGAPSRGARPAAQHHVASLGEDASLIARRR
jgi:hypothetical protein